MDYGGKILREPEMNREQFQEIQKTQRCSHVIKGSDLENQDNRTLIWGYTIEREDFHVFLLNGEINIEVGNLKPRHQLQHWNENEVQSNSEYVPDKRVYPEACDFEFCKFLKEAGVSIPFTTWTDREPQQFYAPIH
jgi:hypothetical protein